jgi:RNA recognition motif-containing protein
MDLFFSRLECSVCGHAWFQSQDRLMQLSDQFEMIELPERDLKRIQRNVEEGKSPKYMGAAKLYVGNVAFGSTEDDLWDVFGKIGMVGDVNMVRDDQGRMRGFAFVTMRDKADAERAMSELNGLDFNGRSLSVRESNN